MYAFADTGYYDYDHFRHIGAVIKKSGEVVKNH